MILLYNPTSTSPGKANLPISLLSLAAVLEGDLAYEIVDGNLMRDPFALLPELIREKQPCLLGMTVMPGPQLNQAVPLSQKLKQLFPELPIVWGGYFPTQHHEVVLASGHVDFVVHGQGQMSLPALVQTLQDGGNPERVKGISFLKDGKVCQTPAQPLTPLTRFSRMPYHRVEMERYIHPNYIGSRTTDQNSSFGCPFACHFCSIVSMTHQGWLPETAEVMAANVRHLVQHYAVNGVLYHDMDFFIKEARVAEFCDRIKSLGIRWWALGRIDELARYSDATWRLMKRSGLKMIFCGAESGSDETLKKMNKGGKASVQLARDLAQKMKHYGIVPEYSFVLGFPPEPQRDAEATFAFIRDLKRLNPALELILYTYTPVPVDASKGALPKLAAEAGFLFPRHLEDWVRPPWREFALRRHPNTPWLDQGLYRRIRHFETVINAYYPTTTDLKLRGLRKLLLKMLGGWRYHLRFYHYPLELQLLHRFLAYQRPETTGF